ncbi:MAG: SAM-dependent chlorinase/fluorinase [Planctomycetes bacterium]|nr:SAM-dependent chlorinase/fluorinase [Planctomycetota bacterium]
MVPEPEASGLVTLTTDFGGQDHYAGVMKGVIAAFNPSARVIDLCHEVAPQDVREAAFLLKASYRYFPGGTVHVVVVDPGVGTRRRVLCVVCAGQRFLAPDNGVLSYVLAEAGAWEAVEVTESRFFLPSVSWTFHGRDVFAPVAARLARGVALRDLGTPVWDPVLLAWPEPRVEADGTRVGEVVHVDRFGNLVTNLPVLPGGYRGVRAGATEVGDSRTSYAAVDEGQVLAIIGSSGLLEVSVNGGSAERVLGLGRGAEVRARPGRAGQAAPGRGETT